MAYPIYQQPPERPVVVTVVAIILIVLGGLALLGIPFSVMQLTGAFPMPGPAADWLQDPDVRTWMTVSCSVGGTLAVAEIVAGIGLLAMRRWARYFAIGVLVFGLLNQIGTGIATQALDITGRLFASMGPPPAPHMDEMMGTVTTIATVGGIIFWGAVHVTLIVLLCLRSVRQAFDAKDRPSPYPYVP